MEQLEYQGKQEVTPKGLGDQPEESSYWPKLAYKAKTKLAYKAQKSSIYLSCAAYVNCTPRVKKYLMKECFYYQQSSYW